MRRRILLVDDEVAVLLTLKAVLEISGFDVDTAASAREGVSKLHTREYQMLITDMRMEHDVAGVEVIKAARAAAYHPAVALLTAFPVAEEDWQEMGADQLLVKPMHTRILLQQIEDLIASHERKLADLGIAVSPASEPEPASREKISREESCPPKKSSPNHRKKPHPKNLPQKRAPAKPQQKRRRPNQPKSRSAKQNHPQRRQQKRRQNPPASASRNDAHDRVHRHINEPALA